METAQQELAKRKQLQDLSALIAGAHSLDELIVGGPVEKIVDFFGADRATIYIVDTKNNHLVSIAKSGAELKEIRVERHPYSIAGYVGTELKSVLVNDVYNATELARIATTLRFDVRWDQATGYRTRSMVCVPVLYDRHLLGVLQIINKKDGGEFGPRDQNYAEEIAKRLGLAFFNFNRMKTIRQAKRTKWDSLVESGAISIEVLTQALVEAAAAQMDQARFLIDKIGVKKVEIEKSLAMHYNCRAYHFKGDEKIPDDLRTMVRSIDFFKQNCAVPLEVSGASYIVVIDDPTDIGRTDSLRRVYNDRPIIFQVALGDDILACVERSSSDHKDAGTILRSLEAQDGVDPSEDASKDDADEKEVASQNELVQFVEQIITDAFAQRASDIHVEPYGKERETMVRFRVDGDLHEYTKVPPKLRNAIVSRIKIMAQLDIAEKRKPQDGKIKFDLPPDRKKRIELRVATVPTVGGNEDVVMRILAASKPLPIDQMNLSARNLEQVKKVMTQPYGLMLCVGPTGSGKTTTLHSCLGFINTPDMKIWTAEDPVEITQYGLRQVQVQSKIGFTFEAAMRAFLRADPDVIMVGEMRDKETAGTGIEASLTGHLVVSTLHTNSAPETITRLLDMELDPFSFADALLGILAQRLARGLCKACKQAHVATQEEFETIALAFGGVEGAATHGYVEGTTQLWHGAGCDDCGGSGYKGRVALHELLVNDDKIKRAIVRKAPIDEVRNLSIEGGMTTLLQDGVEKSVSGLTDLKQVLAVCSR